MPPTALVDDIRGSIDRRPKGRGESTHGRSTLAAVSKLAVLLAAIPQRPVVLAGLGILAFG
jgi:hypothetical protein